MTRHPVRRKEVDFILSSILSSLHEDIWLWVKIRVLTRSVALFHPFDNRPLTRRFLKTFQTFTPDRLLHVRPGCVIRFVAFSSGTSTGDVCTTTYPPLFVWCVCFTMPWVQTSSRARCSFYACGTCLQTRLHCRKY